MEKDLGERSQTHQLEELVRIRTAALKEAQVQLEQAVIERKRAEAEQARLLAAERAQTRRQVALVRLSAELAATLDESEVCWGVVRGLSETLGYAIVVIMLLDELTGERIVAAQVGYEEIPYRIPPGQGLNEISLLDGHFHYYPDVSCEPVYVPGAWGSEVDVPIRIGGKVLGVLSAENREKNAFNQEDFEVLIAASHQAGLAIEKARLLASERQRADELEALRTTMAEITAELGLSPLLHAIVERASGMLDATGGELGLFDETSREVLIVVSHNLGGGYVGTRHPLGEGAMGHVAAMRQPLIIEDYLTWEARAPRYASVQIHASMAAPLMVGGRLVGVISLASTDLDRQFSPADLHLLNLFAQQAAIAIENARLYDQAQREIAERKRAEEALQLAKESAETANRAKSVFLTNMSHELRTPLNAILGFTQLMNTDPNLTALQQDNLAIINRSGEHLLALINDVLEMSKIEAGRVTLQEQSFDLYRLLDTIEEMFRLRAEGKGLDLWFERAENTPQYVCMDEGKLRQVLMNLLGNAVKFTSDGGVTLRVARAADLDCLLVEVADTGSGIAPDELEAVFEPFFQTVSGQHFREGTGLGLSISRQFARLMGGEITLVSEVGKGSIFRVELPFGQVDGSKIEAGKPTRQVLGLEPGQPVYRLLIVDDRTTTRQLLIRMLEPLGFAVREAVHGRQAIEIWQSWQPDLIWMDMKMPIMDGYQATRQIKASVQGRSTVIIALTASAFDEDQALIFEAGCDDIVRKPFREEEIFDKLVEHLNVRFIYCEGRSPTIPTPPRDIQDILVPGGSAVLPTSWWDELRKATIKADQNLILSLADQVHEQDEALADMLSGLAFDFKYQQILQLIDRAGG